MKKTILYFLTLVFILTGCDKTNQINGAPAPTYTDLYFERMENLIECIKSDGETGDGQDIKNIDIENYPELVKIKESGEIPTLVDNEGDNVIAYAGGTYLTIHGEEKYMDTNHRSQVLIYYGLLNENSMDVEIHYLEDDYLNSVTEPDYYEYCEYKGWKAWTGEGVLEKKVQLADKEIKAVVEEKDGNIGRMTFFDDDYMIVIIVGKNQELTYDYLSGIKVGHVSIE